MLPLTSLWETLSAAPGTPGLGVRQQHPVQVPRSVLRASLHLRRTPALHALLPLNLLLSSALGGPEGTHRTACRELSLAVIQNSSDLRGQPPFGTRRRGWSLVDR